MVRKQKAFVLSIRVPKDVKQWVLSEADRNASSQNAQIVRAIRDRMDAERRERERAGQ